MDTRLVYFGTLAFFQVGGRQWPAWEERLRASVGTSQRVDDDDERGSWESTGSETRTAATALRALSLEIAYYAYKRVFRDNRER